MTRTSEDAHFTWIAHWITDLAQDLRYAFRGMRRNTGFTTFTILIAGLGIGASSTVFSVVNALLLRPLPFRDPGRLVWISNSNDVTSTQTEHYADLRELNRSFSDVAAFADWGVGNRQLSGTGEPERLTSVPVTGRRCQSPSSGFSRFRHFHARVAVAMDARKTFICFSVWRTSLSWARSFIRLSIGIWS